MTAERPGAGLGLWVVALASLFALRLLMVATSADSLHVDEAQYWDWSRTLQWGYYSKPPAIAVLIAASDAVFGSAEIGVRALAMACYPLTAVVLAALARDIVAGDEAVQARPDKGSGHAPAAAWWAAALFMASPIAGLLGMVATTDALLLLCWASALWALWQAVVRRRHRAWVGFAAACGVGLLDKYSMLALLPGAAVFVWRRGDRRAMAGLLASGAAALLLWSPNLWWNAQAGWPTLRHTADITLRQQDAGGAGVALASLAEFSLGQVLILAPLLLPWLAWSVGRGRRADAEWPGSALPRAAACLLFWTSLPMAAALTSLPPSVPSTPPAPGAPGPFAFADPDRVRGILADAGFADVALTPTDMKVGGGDLETVLAMSLKVGPLGALLREHPEHRDGAIAAVREALAAHDGPDGVKLGSATWVVTARA